MRFSPNLLNRCLCLVIFIALLFCASAALAANAVYRHAVMYANFPWDEGLTIEFEPDEALCKKYYGKAWRSKCSVALGRPGNSVAGVRLVPAATGQWQWQTPTKLAFLPENKNSIKPDTLYKADISGIGLPAFVKLNSTLPQCRTQPLAARLLESRFWVDPSPGARHRLTMSFQFNFPAPADGPHLKLIVPSGARFGEPETVWNQNRDRLSLSWPVTQLPNVPGLARLDLPGYGEIYEQDGMILCKPANAGGASFVQAVPSPRDLLKITGLKLEARSNASLDRAFVFDIDLSLQARAQDVQDMLEVWELPQFASKEAIKPYDWSMAPALSSDMLAKVKPLQLTPLQKKDAVRTRFQFEAPVKSGRYALVKIRKGLRSQSGETLAADWHGVVQAAPIGATVGFLQPGNILSGEGILDIYGIGVDEIQWDAQLVREPFLALLAHGSDAPYADPLDKSSLDMDALSQRQQGSIELQPGNEGKARYASLALAPVLENLSGSPSGIVLLSLKGKAGGKPVAEAKRLLALTNLTLLLKRGSNGSYDVFCRDLAANKSAADAEVCILGANGKKIATSKTDRDGHAFIETLAGFDRERAPVAAVAKLGSSIAWLSLQDRSRQLDFGNFDVGGQHVGAGDIVAFAFSQRGVYRPGDTLYFGCIPRKSDFTLLPANLPLYAELLNPRGQRIWERTFLAGQHGIAELAWDSSATSISGRYTLNIRNGRSGSLLTSTSARLESFQPDSLKMRVNVPAIKGWLVTAGNSNAVAEITLQNLYGTPAKGHKAKGRVEIAPASFCFPGLEEWTFTDPAPFIGNGSQRNLGVLQTDSQGKASFELPVDLFGSASARITVSAEGFEISGGRGTGASASFLSSPMPKLLGYKLGGALTNPDFIDVGQKASLELIAVDSELQPVDWRDLRFSILRRNYVTNLISDGQGGCRYADVPQELLFKSWRADLPAEGLEAFVDTDEPGEFLFEARDAAGHVLARVPYNVVGEKLQDGAAPLAGSKMRLTIDKREYASGDEIRVAFSLPYAAAGILSIERDGVRAWRWIDAHAGDNTASLKIPENFEGRGHVVAAFARSPTSDSIYMNPLAYAAAPFNSNIKVRNMDLRLEAPKLAAPGGDLEIRLSAGKPGQAAVFVVDEGILQLTAFATPKPLAALLGDRALDVATLQAVDLLMPDHGRLSRRVAAFGGGSEVSPFGAKFQNPFKRRSEPPVAVWTGLVNTGPEPVAIKIPLPAWYNGEVRVMAVGSGKSGAGSASALVKVRAPLVVSPQLPLALAPGDIFEGSLVLANVSREAMNIKAAMLPDSAFAVIKDLQADISLAAGEERSFPFVLKANAMPGSPRITFRCASENDIFERSMSISIRPASGLLTSIAAGLARKSGDLPKSRRVYAQGASSDLLASCMPIPLAFSLNQYLETYPFGCTEQLVSRAFAHVALAKWPLPQQDPQKRQKLLGAAINAINSRFVDGMGVSLWDGGQPDLLLTAYAADFLLTLRESGLGGADQLLARLCDALRWTCALNEPSLAAARSSAYAIWVLAREGNVVTQLVEELDSAIKEKNIAGFNKDIGHALLRAAMLEMRLPVRLDIRGLDFAADGWFDEYAQNSLAVALLARYDSGYLNTAAKNDYFSASILKLNENAFSTFSAAQGARALAALAGAGSPALQETTVKCLDGNADVKIDFSQDGSFLSAKTSVCSQYGLEFKEGDEIFWQVATTGFNRENALKAEAHGIEISRALCDLNGKPIKSLKQGEEAVVRLTIRAQRDRLADCVISSLLPGGVEMVIPRKETLPTGIKSLDRQEDRMLVFADLSNQPFEVAYRIRAVVPGSYSFPPAQAEAMYNRSIYGVTEPGSLEILKE